MASAPRLLIAILVSMVVLVLQVGLADAATKYNLVNTIGGFTTPTDVTVDQSTGNVYVTDSGTNSVDIVGPEGGSPIGGVVTPITGAPGMEFMFGNLPAQTAIDESGGPSNGDLYVGEGFSGHRVVDKFALNGATHKYEYVCQFTGVGNGCVAEGGAPTWSLPWAVAVDGAGNVFISSGERTVSEFSTTGGDIAQFTGEGHIRTPAGLAVANDGTLYINGFHRNLVKLIPGGEESLVYENNEEHKPTAVALDARGDLFVDDSSYVTEYDGLGAQINQFGEVGTGICQPIAESRCSEGVAVDDASEHVYVTDREAGTVDVFAPVVVPDVTTGVAENVGKTSATLTGTVDPVGVGEAHYFFQYGESTAYGQETAEASTSGVQEAQVGLTGLSPGVEYHYRLVARNANGTNFGPDMTFKTPPSVTYTPCPPVNLRGTSASLCVTIDPEGLETSYGFMYGPQAPVCSSVFECFSAYELHTEFVSAGSGAVEERFTLPVGGLLPVVTYHYRVIAFNELGFTLGPDETFTTPPVEPTVNDRPPFATEVALHEATLHGTINPGQGVTEYHFVYGSVAGEYTQSGPVAYTPLNYEDDQVSQLITGLEPGRVYHYTLVASNASGTVTGADGMFATISSTPPDALTGEASEISPTSATLSGTIDPRERPVSYVFELGASTIYGTRVYGSLASGASSESVVGVSVGGLLPGMTYHYRLVASSVSGVSFGADRTFTTPLESAMLSVPPAPLLVAAPVFPVVETSASAHRGLVKKHKRAKRRKTVHKKTKRGRRATRSGANGRGIRAKGRVTR